MIHRHPARGFTLIELMIVVAIIGILAAVALPAYQNYTLRARVSEGLTLADAAKTAVSVYYSVHNKLPDDSDQADLGPLTGASVDSVTIVAGGTIRISYKPPVASGGPFGALLWLRPTAPAGGGPLTWECQSDKGSAKIPQSILPPNCRTP